MTPERDKPKRWRPRWSVRTLVIVVTLVCAYLACWGPTKNRGVNDVLKHVDQGSNTSRTMPLIVGIDVFVYDRRSTVHRYYFWFFGYVAKLPYEGESNPWPSLGPAE